MVRALTLLLLLLLGGPAWALMPPHVTGTEPADGGVLVGDTITFEGYTLSEFTARKAKVRDETAGADVPFVASVECSSQGKGDMPGAVQQRCALKLKLAEVVKGHRYVATLLGTTVTVTAGDAPASQPASQPPK